MIYFPKPIICSIGLKNSREKSAARLTSCGFLIITVSHRGKIIESPDIMQVS